MREMSVKELLQEAYEEMEQEKEEMLMQRLFNERYGEDK